MSTTPGWYPDPAGSPDLRYWDGQVWSAATAPAPRAAVAAAQVPAAAAEPVSSQLDGYFQAVRPAGPSSAAGDRSGPLASVGTPEPGGIPAPRGASYPAPGRLQATATPKSSISGRMVAAAAGAIAVAVGAVLLLNQHHGGPTRVSAHTTIQMPSAVAGLPQIHTSDVDALNRIMSGSAVPKPNLVGFYGTTPNSPTAFLMVAKYPQTASQVEHNLSMALRSLDESVGNVVFWHSADTGPLGGQMRCADVVQSAQSATVCMFEDTDVIGLTFSVGTAAAPGPDAITLRDAIEHRS